MTLRSLRGALLGLAVAAVTVGTVVSAPLAAQADQTPSSSPYSVYVPGVSAAEQSKLDSMLLVSPGCGTGAKEDTVIKKWERRAGSTSTAYLRCGTQTTSGLRHINNGHGQDWENVRSKYAQPGTWDSFMENITAANLVAPSTKITTADNKDVYHGYLCVRKISNGELVRVYDTIIPVGRSNSNIVTSYFENGRASDPHC